MKNLFQILIAGYLITMLAGCYSSKIRIATHSIEETIDVIVSEVNCPGYDCAWIDIKEKGEKTQGYYISCGEFHPFALVQKWNGEEKAVTSKINENIYLSYGDTLIVEVPIFEPISPIEKRAFEIASPNVRTLTDCSLVDLTKIIGFVKAERYKWKRLTQLNE